MIVLRDDDISFHTTLKEIEESIVPLIKLGYKINLGVIPYAIKAINKGDQINYYEIEDSNKYIFENSELVNCLKEWLLDGKVEVCMHGFNHSYNKMKDKFIPEFKNIGFEEAKEKIHLGKEILEDTFNQRIKVFTPPSNFANISTLKVLREENLSISANLSLRNFSLTDPIRFVKEFKNTNRPFYYLGVKHYPLTPFYNVTIQGRPKFIATHYWEISKNGFPQFLIQNYDPKDSILFKEV